MLCFETLKTPNKTLPLPPMYHILNVVTIKLTDADIHVWNGKKKRKKKGMQLIGPANFRGNTIIGKEIQPTARMTTKSGSLTLGNSSIDLWKCPNYWRLKEREGLEPLSREAYHWWHSNQRISEVLKSLRGHVSKIMDTVKSPTQVNEQGMRPK